MRMTLAITGASGAVYGLRLLMRLTQARVETHLIVSKAARVVLAEEEGLVLPDRPSDWRQVLRTRGIDVRFVHCWGEEDWHAPCASGSSAPRAMAVVPCSMGTLARIAQGISGNLIERAADVALKEGFPLVLVPRETPLSVIHLENMLRAARAGACVLPAAPGFYHRPERLEELVDFVVERILAQLGMQHAGKKIVWQGGEHERKVD